MYTMTNNMEYTMIANNKMIDLKAFADDWLNYARLNGFHPKVIAFIEANPRDLFPEDGSSLLGQWAKVSNFLVSNFFDGVGGNVDGIFNMLVGAQRYARFKAFTYDQ